MSAYSNILVAIFMDKFDPTDPTADICFSRNEITIQAQLLNINVPKNIGDILYTFRYRQTLPVEIISATPEGYNWTIIGLGRSEYCFRLTKQSNILPNLNILPIKIPNNTPEVLTMYSLSDEQSLLAKVRYNRLIDMFLGIVAYSMQNHLRTQVKGIGQIEIDELYIGLNKIGQHFIIPVQAKIGTDKIGYVQLYQDIIYCKQIFTNLHCIPIAVNYVASDNRICVFRLSIEEDSVLIIEEKHYKLVVKTDIEETYINKLNSETPRLLE